MPRAAHPEAYPVGQAHRRCLRPRRAQPDGRRGDALRGLSPAKFVDERFGLPTVKDILAELEKPGRDPARKFKTATPSPRASRRSATSGPA